MASARKKKSAKKRAGTTGKKRTSRKTVRKAGKKAAKAARKKTAKKKGFGWGGARPGAGRKPSPDSGVPHHPRDAVKPGDSLLVVQKLKPEYSRLTPAVLVRIAHEAAELGGGERFGFQLEDVRAKKGELRLACKARNRRALGRGVQGLSIRIARAINRRLGTEGSVFADRYELKVFDSAAARQREM